MKLNVLKMQIQSINAYIKAYPEYYVTYSEMRVCAQCKQGSCFKARVTVSGLTYMRLTVG